MRVVDSYIDYQHLIKETNSIDLVYGGELIASNISDKIGDAPIVYIVWNCKLGLECCKVINDNGKLSIQEVTLCEGLSIENIDLLSSLECDSSREWHNLCHYMDKDTMIHYDSYYDPFPAFDVPDSQEQEQKLTMGELRELVSRYFADNLCFEESEIVLLAGELGKNHLIHDVLRRIFGVKTLNSGSYGEELTTWSRNYEIIDAKSALSLYLPAISDQVFSTQVISALCGNDYGIIVDKDSIPDFTVFPGVSIQALIDSVENPDMRMQDINILWLNLRVEKDMIGNQQLIVEHPDRESRFFVAMNAISIIDRRRAKSNKLNTEA